MTVFYLSGPMTGVTDCNYPMFNQVAGKLRAAGLEVRNPAEHYGGDKGLARHKYLALDVLTLIRECRGIVFLPGWMGADGARLEAQLALDLKFDDYGFWHPYNLGGALRWANPYEVDVALNGA